LGHELLPSLSNRPSHFDSSFSTNLHFPSVETTTIITMAAEDEKMEEDQAEQVRVTFSLDTSVKDTELEVPSDPIAIPSTLRRKGLSAVINHLLDRRLEDDDEKDDDDSDDGEKLSAVTFDFMINGKLLRTGVETAARRYGLSLEEAIQITYFPAQQAPEESGESEPVPDWISCVSTVGNLVFTAGYDGCLSVHKTTAKGLDTIGTTSAHVGPIKCLAAAASGDTVIIATGSLDQSLVTHIYRAGSLEMQAKCQDGHTSSIGCVDISAKQSKLVSGDWDGGLAIWDLSAGAEEPTSKKRKSSGKEAKTTTVIIKPVASFAAHGSQISGVAWLKDEEHVVTGSWDHSVKVWNIAQQDCLLTLNGSRVVSCLSLSPHSEVVATGHPDCTIRLWDIRTSTNEESASLVSDSSLKPSHKAWVSAVEWSPTNPYVLTSASHDGTLKVWDIRSSLPLHTVRAHSKEDKSLCLAYGDGMIYTAGTECVVKQYTC
jgi:ribosome biogenesis protein YTM1